MTLVLAAFEQAFKGSYVQLGEITLANNGVSPGGENLSYCHGWGGQCCSLLFDLRQLYLG